MSDSEESKERGVETLVDGWVCGTSLDEPAHAHFTDVFETRHEAIAAAPDELGLPAGDGFQTGYLRHTKDVPPNPFDVDHELDRYEHDDWDPDTVTEGFVDKAMLHATELQTQLDEIWAAWIAKHDLAPVVFFIDDLEHHTIGEDMDDADSADAPSTPVA